MWVHAAGCRQYFNVVRNTPDPKSLSATKWERLQRAVIDDQGNRIQASCVDYDQPVSFSFNGRKITGYRGDSIASALLAADIRLVGRSYKYGRPRGIVAAGPEEPNAILQLGKREARRYRMSVRRNRKSTKDWCVQARMAGPI